MTGGHPDTLSDGIPYEPRAKQLNEGYKQGKIEGNDARDTDTRVMWQGTELVSTKWAESTASTEIISPSAVL
jgi:hypothetical protein